MFSLFIIHPRLSIMNDFFKVFQSFFFDTFVQFDSSNLKMKTEEGFDFYF